MECIRRRFCQQQLCGGTYTSREGVSIQPVAAASLLCLAFSTRGGSPGEKALGIMRPDQAVNRTSSTPASPTSTGFVRALQIARTSGNTT